MVLLFGFLQCTSTYDSFSSIPLAQKSHNLHLHIAQWAAPLSDLQKAEHVFVIESPCLPL